MSEETYRFLSRGRDKAAGRSRRARLCRKRSAYSGLLGVKPVCVVGCFGAYDFVSITDYPNEAAALKAVGYAVSTGNVQIQTLPACPIETFFQVRGELPR